MTPIFAAGFAALLMSATAGAYSAIPATLLTSIDAQTTKSGDEVSAQTGEAVKSDGRVLLPKGSKLMGHVVEVKARADDQPTSQIVLTFNRAVTKDAKEIPITASIASISRAQGAAAPSSAAGSDTGAPSSASGAAASPKQGQSGGSQTAPPAAGGDEHTSGASGAFTLQQRASRTVISSNSENVHLASGTQLLMQVKTGE